VNAALTILVAAFPMNSNSVLAFPKGKAARAGRHSKASLCIHSRPASAYEQAVQRAVATPEFAPLFLTIWLGGTSHGKATEADAVEWLLDEARRWLKRTRLPYYALWVVEVGAIKGPHLHALIHCPREHRRAFRKAIKDKLSPSCRGAVQIRNPKVRGEGFECQGCGRPRNWQHLALCYFLKGGSAEVRRRNGIDLCASAAPEKYAQDQGTYVGKRIGFSRSLGKKANRRRVGGGVKFTDARGFTGVSGD
jgi:hypothetical protein